MPRSKTTAPATDETPVEAPAAEAPAEAPAAKVRPTKRYTITKRTVLIRTYYVDAYTEPEALRIADDMGELAADELSTASESWKVHRELTKVVAHDAA